ncbi:F-box protein [Hibiscus syriacus]|uniref:F-box protein n=1 Tax=Hibiscus syriacus TaxID=106335 RepID=A0A6A2YD42_HIBSY|nr:F-box protein [Hibiscus syriacus]
MLSRKIVSPSSFPLLRLEMPVDCHLFQPPLNRSPIPMLFGNPSFQFVAGKIEWEEMLHGVSQGAPHRMERHTILLDMDFYTRVQVDSGQDPIWFGFSLGLWFKEIPELLSVCWFEIRGKISISMLSPLTLYKAYLVYKMHDIYGFEFYPAQLSVGFAGGEVRERASYLDPERGPRLHDWQIEEDQLPTPRYDDQLPKTRPDGWLEVELGELFNEGCIDEGNLEMSVLEIKGGHWKGGLIIQGIEIRAITPNLPL